jgi:hypothetical protein
MLGLWDRVDQLGLREARDHLDLQATEVIKEQQERPDRQEARVFQVPRDLQEIVDNQDQLVILGSSAIQDLVDSLDLQDPQAIQGPLDHPDNRDRLEGQDRKVKLDQLV